MDQREQLSTVADRLGWLFDVVAAHRPAPGTQPDSEEMTWRPYSRAEVGRVLSAELGVSTADATMLVEGVLAGHSEDAAALDVIAEFFGADTAYFGQDPERVAAAQDELLDRALRASQVNTVIACRAVTLPADRRRARLIRVLNVVRGRPGGEGTAARAADVVNPPSPAGPTWHHRDRRDLDQPGPLTWAGANSREVAPVRPLTARELRELCLQLLRDLDIVPPLEPELLCRRLGEHRGRRIKLIAEEVFTTSSVGHLICKPRLDVIVYQRTAPRAQQAHVIYHEVVHLVRAHLDGSGSLTCGALRETATSTGGELYSDWQEWEAEAGATVLSELSRQPAHPRLVSRDTPSPEGGLAAAFGLIRDGWR
jgi:hypothetical protein